MKTLWAKNYRVGQSERGMSAKVVIGVGIAIFGGDVDFRKSKTQIWRNMDRIGNLDRSITTGIVVLRIVTVTTTQGSRKGVLSVGGRWASPRSLSLKIK